MNNVFYDCNIPDDKEGFQLVEVSEDIWKYEAISDSHKTKIENLHKALTKKDNKIKKQAEQITLLLKQKEELKKENKC